MKLNLKRRLCILFLLPFYMVASANTSIKDYQKNTYQTYIHTDFSSWTAWIEQMQNQAFKEKNLSLHLEALKDFYGYIGHLLDTKQNDLADDWTDVAKEYVLEVKKDFPNNADITAYESIFISFQIAVSPYKAPFLVSSLMKTSKKALKLNPNSVPAQMAKANILFYFPEAFGGNKKEALHSYLKMYAHYDKHPEQKQTDWRYLFLLTIIANAYEQVGNLPTAIEWTRKSLAIEPKFRYAKEKLLPTLERKAKEKTNI